MRIPELIATHTNTDFDAFAAMVAAHKLYPEAQISLGGAVNRNVREFQALYADAIPVVGPADVDRASVRRLILVGTVHANRLGDLGDLCGRPGVQVVAFDHHAHPGDLPDYLDPDSLVSSGDGSLVTLLVRIIAERGIPVTPFEATVFSLGIHEDTGSLTFATTTTRDAEALAYCMRAGADTELLEKWLTNALTPAQRITLAGALETAGRASHCGGIGAALGAARGPLRRGGQRGRPSGHGSDRAATPTSSSWRWRGACSSPPEAAAAASMSPRRCAPWAAAATRPPRRQS